MNDSVRVDVGAIEARKAQVSRGLENLPAWIARWFGESFLLMLGIFFGIPALIDWRLPSISELTSARGLFLLLAAFLMSAATVAFRYRNIRKLTTMPSEVVEERTIRNWKYVTGPGWLWRTIRLGLILTLGVGVPIGLLLASDTPVQELPANSRIVMVLAFVAMTAAWAMPMAFVFRWMTIRKQRPIMLSE